MVVAMAVSRWLDVEVRLWDLMSVPALSQNAIGVQNMTDITDTPFRVERGPPHAILKKRVTATPQNGDIKRL